MRTTPTCSPAGPTRRTSGTRMRSLVRGSLMRNSSSRDVVATTGDGCRAATRVEDHAHDRTNCSRSTCTHPVYSPRCSRPERAAECNYPVTLMKRSSAGGRISTFVPGQSPGARTSLAEDRGNHVNDSLTRRGRTPERRPSHPRHRRRARGRGHHDRRRAPDERRRRQGRTRRRPGRARLDLDEARKLINALAGLVTAAAPEISDMHARSLRDGLRSLQLAFREASVDPRPDRPGPRREVHRPGQLAPSLSAVPRQPAVVRAKTPS